MAPMTAVPPTFINFLKLKSSPKANNNLLEAEFQSQCKQQEDNAYISPDTDTFHICNCRYLLDGRSGEYSGYDIPQYDRLL